MGNAPEVIDAEENEGEEYLLNGMMLPLKELASGKLDEEKSGARGARQVACAVDRPSGASQTSCGGASAIVEVLAREAAEGED